ncbi:MAG: hypothetical protein V1491_02290 [archaeon]
MGKKVIIINSVFLVLLSFIIIVLTLTYLPTIGEECIEANLLTNIKYEGCYDISTKSIFLSIDRQDNYEINSISSSFIDNEEKEFKITNLPEHNQIKTYQFNALKDPKIVYISLDIPNIINCEEPKIVILKECSSEKQNISSSISSTEPFNLFEEMQGKPFQESDLLLENLVDRERVWTTICQSEWVCQDWEECEEDIQRRECLDKNNCFIPTENPLFTKTCGYRCRENWICKWSSCLNGFTNPTCTDIYNCGTEFTKPGIISCKEPGECIPDIKCTPWSKCEIDYNFEDLTIKTETINGTKIRLCEDKNSCTDLTYEVGRCSITVDIEARKKVVQNTLFIEIYNKLTNKIVAIIKDDRNSGASSLDIYF